MKQAKIGPELIAGCLANRRVAQRELYAACLPHLHLVARRYLRNESDIKDILQDSFLQLFTKLDQYDTNRATFKTWSARIVINNCLKRNDRAARQACTELDEVAAAVPTIDPEALTQLNNAELTDWLRTMPETYYTVFNLHVIEGYAHEEVAKLLGIAPALSRQRLTRARKWLAQSCELDRSGPLRAEYVARTRLKVAPLLILIFHFLGQGQ